MGWVVRPGLEPGADRAATVEVRGAAGDRGGGPLAGVLRPRPRPQGRRPRRLRHPRTGRLPEGGGCEV